MTNLDSILKSRDITSPTKVCLVKAMVFPVVMYECESWTIKKAECWRTDAFELWCWRRLLRVSWAARRSNQSILKEISPEYSLEGLMLKLKLQYFGHLMRRTDSLERPWCREGLKAGREGDNRGWDGWMVLLTDECEFAQALGVGDGQGNLAYYSPCCRKESERTEQLNWSSLYQIHACLQIIEILMSTLKCVKNKKSCIKKIMASLVAQMVRNLPAMQETQVQSLDWKASLEKDIKVDVLIPLFSMFILCAIYYTHTHTYIYIYIIFTQHFP